MAEFWKKSLLQEVFLKTWPHKWLGLQEQGASLVGSSTIPEASTETLRGSARRQTCSDVPQGSGTLLLNIPARGRMLRTRCSGVVATPMRNRQLVLGCRSGDARGSAAAGDGEWVLSPCGRGYTGQGSDGSSVALSGSPSHPGREAHSFILSRICA